MEMFKSFKCSSFWPYAAPPGKEHIELCVHLYRCVYICMCVYVYIYIYLCLYVYTLKTPCCGRPAFCRSGGSWVDVMRLVVYSLTCQLQGWEKDFVNGVMWQGGGKHGGQGSVSLYTWGKTACGCLASSPSSPGSRQRPGSRRSSSKLCPPSFFV